MAEHSAVNRRVVGSSPTRGVFLCPKGLFFVYSIPLRGTEPCHKGFSHFAMRNEPLLMTYDSSMAEHCGEFPRYRWIALTKAVSAVNRRVVGSSPTRGVFFMP